MGVLGSVNIGKQDVSEVGIRIQEIWIHDFLFQISVVINLDQRIFSRDLMALESIILKNTFN